MTKSSPVGAASAGADVVLRRPSRLVTWLRNALPVTVAFLVFVGLWQLGITIFKPQPFIVPGPLNVLQAFQEQGASLWESTLITLRATAVAFGLSAVLGAAVSFLLTSIPILYKAVFPLTVVFQSVPVIVFVPLLLTWFGIGMPSIIAVAVIISIFPIIANTAIGLRSTDASLKQLFQLYGANSWQSLFKLRLPAALPYFFAGLRIAAGASVIGVVVGEYMAGMASTKGGLGFLVVETASRLQMAQLAAAGLCAAILGISFFLLVGYVGNLFLKNWHESAREER
ncbi:MAG: ABC transporter permease [Thermaceae bacterium]|nr:ABC transporter permease [Thermaceae bacterium]